MPATRSLPGELLGRLAYDTNKAVPYSEDALASWPAEIYSVSMSDASLTARDIAIEASDKEVTTFTTPATLMPTDDSGHNVRVDRSQLAVISYKLLLLPLWTAAYTYKGEMYRLLVNGQSGQVEGDVPGKGNPVSTLLGR